MSDTLTERVGAAAATAPPPLLDELDGYLTCAEILEITHDVSSFEFEVSGPSPLVFLPGQYLTFRFLIGGRHVERCYTISSAPTHPGRLQVPEHLQITVKRVPGGIVSNWLHDNLQVGDAIGASGPFGRFSCAIHPSDQYLFLTAGSGITPAMSMMRTLRETAEPANVVFIHCARTPDDIIFRGELEGLTADHGVTVAILCEDDSPNEKWRGSRGRLTPAALLQVAPDLLRREIFTCGPPPYMRAVRELLSLLGVDPTRSHEESFELGAADPTAPVPATGTTYRVHFERSGQIVECDSSTTILEAGARAGIPLLSSCGEGVCGTCKLTLLSGQVDMQHQGGIRQREIDQQKILACCSTPIGDVTVDA